MTRLLAACVLALCATIAAAQAPKGAPGPNGVFLIAKPELTDPNFARTVVLVTQTEDFSTVGVVVNRPTTLKLSDFPTDDGVETAKYRDPIFLGGPVMRQALVAVFHAETPPAAPAFHVLRTLYMTMHSDNMRELLGSTDRRYRLYAGFSGWAPRQLENEFNREGWLVLPADEDTVFRENTEGMWEELVQRAQALKTRGGPLPQPPQPATAAVNEWPRRRRGRDARLKPGRTARAMRVLRGIQPQSDGASDAGSFGPAYFPGSCPDMLPGLLPASTRVTLAELHCPISK